MQNLNTTPKGNKCKQRTRRSIPRSISKDHHSMRFQRYIRNLSLINIKLQKQAPDLTSISFRLIYLITNWLEKINFYHFSVCLARISNASAQKLEKPKSSFVSSSLLSSSVSFVLSIPRMKSERAYDDAPLAQYHSILMGSADWDWILRRKREMGQLLLAHPNHSIMYSRIPHFQVNPKPVSPIKED